MRGKGMSLRSKMMIGLLIAVALPYLVGITILRTVSYPQHLSARGKLYQAEADSAGAALEQAVRGESERFRLWMTSHPDLGVFLEEENKRIEAMEPAALRAQTMQREKEWAQSLRGDEPVRAVLENRGAVILRAFQQLSRLTSEIQVADEKGRTIAATQKTTDYNQADETWWQHGMTMDEEDVWCDALHYDDSADAHSLDLIFRMGKGKRGGVVKMVVNVTPLFRDLRYKFNAEQELREVVLPDGRAVVRLSSNGKESGVLHSASETVMATVRAKKNGWMIGPLNGNQQQMLGFAPLEMSMNGTRVPLGGYVLVATPKEEVIAPVKRYLLWLAGAMVGVMSLSALAGYLFVNKEILEPLSAVGSAVRSIAETTNEKSKFTPPNGRKLAIQGQTEVLLKEVNNIHPNDEIGALAKDFGVMADKILHYQSDLEAEVNVKTAMIRQDLEMAREFQRALLPEGYPIIPSPNVNNPLRLGFTHLYQPATTVGGDFFDLLQLDDSRAGVLVADVMGHGARSALITAILRALVQHEGAQILDPAEFLQTLNHQLYEIIARSGQTLFVTAFFMILDTRNCTTSWAVAGHPAPLRIREGENDASFLWAQSLHQPALGLMSEVVYQSFESKLQAGDTFLIYTDGVIEADSPGGEAFGNERLRRLFGEAVDSVLSDIPLTIIQELHEFQGCELTEDDVCLVAVQARAPAGHEADGLHA